MKYYSCIFKTRERDISALSKFISDDRPECVFFKFEEQDKEEILKILQDICKVSLNTMNCIGEDNYIYEISADGITKTSCKFSLKKQYKLNKKSYKMYEKYIKHFGKLLENTTKTKSVEKFTISKFKFRIFVSKEYEIVLNYRFKKSQKEHRPIVVFLHGGGCSGCDNIKPIAEFYGNHIWSKLKKYDCNIIIPQTPFTGIDGEFKYLDAIKQLSEYITKEVNADENRIYIFGTSAGGHCTWQSAYDYPDYYACAMSVMGTLNVGYTDDVDYNRLKNIPILVAHSSNDKIVPIERNDQTVEILKSISANIEYSRWNKYGHKMASKFYKRKNWDEWMFQQNLEKR